MNQYQIISTRHGRLSHKYSDLTQACREMMALMKCYGHCGVDFYIEATS